MTMTKLVGTEVLWSNDYWLVSHAGGVVTINASNIKLGKGSWDYVTCPYTLPVGMRPPRTVYAACCTQNGGSTTAVLSVHSDGKIYVSNQGSSGSDNMRVGSLSFPAMQ